MSSNAKIVAAATLAVALLAPSHTFAQQDPDDCILEHTYDCLDDADFWGCYDFIVDACRTQGDRISVNSFAGNNGGGDNGGPKRAFVATTHRVR